MLRGVRGLQPAGLLDRGAIERHLERVDAGAAKLGELLGGGLMLVVQPKGAHRVALAGHEHSGGWLDGLVV